MILEVENLCVSYWGKDGYVDALNKISFAVEEKEIFGVVGESASGKSTLAYSILNLLPPDAKKEGKIIFQQEDIFSLSEKQLELLRANKIGLIFQEPASMFNPVLSIGYQFEEFLSVKSKVRSKNERQNIIFDSFRKVRLKEKERIIKSYPHQLSGGQLQRVAIAMAISLRPQILIADEPTSSLDVTIESQIIHLFRELRDKLNLTIIFITHNLSLVKVLCDNVIVIYKGNIREIQKTEELFANPQDDYTKSLLAALRCKKQ